MLLRLLIFKRLSPTLFRLQVAAIIAVGLLFLAFVTECAFLILRQVARAPLYPAIHSTDHRQ